MALNAWQKLQSVMPGKPFGKASDGASYTVSSNATISTTYLSCSGSATSSTLTIASAGFANQDVVMICQMRGTGVGQWEVNKVVSGGGSTSLTLMNPLQYTYTDSGASQAQVIKILQFGDLTINGGVTWSAPAWDGNVGGIMVVAANRTLTVSGALNANSMGHIGGDTRLCTTNTDTAYKGEGSAGASAYNTSSDVSANGNSGGGGMRGATGYTPGAGGGGSYGTQGTAGQGDSPRPGQPGNTAGDTELKALFMGGSGGGGAASNDGGTNPGGNGGKGGGMIIIFAKDMVAPASIVANGANGGNGTIAGPNGNGGGGGAAGGSILLCTQTVNLGSDKLSVTGGTGGLGKNSQDVGGNGGKGRIAVYYGKTTAGSVSSSLYGSLTSEQDLTLVESTGGSFLYNFI